VSHPRLHLYDYDLRLRRGVRLGYSKLERRAGVLVAVDTGERELIGLGEAAPAWWAGDEASEVAREALVAAREWFARKQPCLADLEAAWRNSDLLPEELAAALAPSRAAASALAVAVSDHHARSAGRSMTEHLGGRAGVCTTNDLIVADNAGDIATEVGRAVALDYRTVKLKVGAQDAASDLAHIATAIQTGRGRIRLRLDANQSWNRAHAVEVHPQDLIALKQQCGIAVAMDESITSDADVDRFSEACDVIVLKPGRLGGPWAALGRARHAKATGLAVTVTDSLESCVGRATCLHLALSIGDGSHASGLAGAALLGEDLSTDPNLLRGAKIEPTGPGLLAHSALQVEWPA
jgi:L-alanine-DL-glutamate epimerase-like enolase superfamily enzyme